jgi:hypothetical protein
MAKVIDSVELSLQMWSTVVLSADEIQDIYPEFADMVDVDDTDALEQAIQDHMDMNYYEYVNNSDGALDECTVHFVYEDDGSE